MDNYSYQQLPAPNYIRLLTLNVDDFSGSLDIYCLDTCPEYIALSYTWGKGGLPQDFLCSGARLPLQPNLYNALQQFQHSEIDKPIWIDAICINQREIAEKEHQIPLMAQIYSEAFKVYVWLGGATQIDEEAFLLLPSIVEILENADDKVLNLSQSWKLPVQSVYGRLGLPPPTSPIWPTIGRIITRPWFKRLWVLQEVLLAASIDVFCGGARVAWKYLARLERQVARWNLKTTLQGNQITESEIDAGLDSLWSFMWCRNRKEHNNAKNISVFSLLDVAKRKEVTNLHDLVYGILGLTTKTIRDRVNINYSLPPTQVYIDFVASNLPQDTELELFSHVSGPSNRKNQVWDQNIPSWCPLRPWMVENTRDPNFTLGAAEGLRAGYHAGFNGSFRGKPLCTTLHGSNLVQLQGYKFDRVVRTIATTELHNGSDPLDGAGASALLQWESCCFDLAAENLIRSQREPQTIQLGVCEEDLILELQAESLNNMLNVYTRTLIANRECVFDGLEWQYRAFTGKSTKDGDPEFADTVAQYQNWKAFLREIRDAREGDVLPTRNPYLVMHASYRRDFIATEHGRIGWGPEGVEVGDVITVFDNGIVPHILRPRQPEEPMLLAGEAYIDGLMYGEVFVMAKEGKVALSTIKIS